MTCLSEIAGRGRMMLLKKTFGICEQTKRLVEKCAPELLRPRGTASKFQAYNEAARAFLLQAGPVPDTDPQANTGLPTPSSRFEATAAPGTGSRGTPAFLPKGLRNPQQRER